MSLDGVHGFLDVESAALRAPQVGIANSAPQHILSVGSNLYVSGDSSDVLTVDGNVVCEGVKVGLIEITPSYDLEAVANVGNSTSNTIQFTNPDTGIVTTGNVTVGKTLTVEGFRITAQAAADDDLQAITTSTADKPDAGTTNQAIRITNAIDSTSASTGALQIGTNTGNYGGVGVAGNVHVGRGVYTQDLDVKGDAIIRGDLSVLGTTTTIDTDNLRVKDPIIELGKDNTASPMVDLGLVMTRPSGSSNVAVIFDESSDTLEIGYTEGSASDAAIAMDAAPLSVNVNGNLSVTSNIEVGTANLFVDTTNTRIGVGTTSPTESLDVVGNMNLQHVSNTSSIKLNSNVVTEFPRSKKLIKYPRVALTGPNDGSGYVVTQNSASTWTSGDPTNNRNAWALFDGVCLEKTGHAGPHFIVQGAADRYNVDGTYAGSDSLGGVSGDWVYIRLPEKIKLQFVNLWVRNILRTPRDATVLGSLDGQNWNIIGSWDNYTPFSGSISSGKFIINANDYYDYIGFVFEKIGYNASGKYVNFHELELYGIPEYDPDAHGTDVVVKSIPNVPNTDWLEVYYDAKDYDNVTSTVDNKTGVSASDATISNSGGTISFDSTYKAWTFGGDTSRTDTFTSPISTSINGNVSLSASMWFKVDVINAGALFSISDSGGEGTSYQSFGVRMDTSSTYQLSFYFWDSDTRYSVPGNAIMINTWYHMVVTYDGANRNLYLNGENRPQTSSLGDITTDLALPNSNLQLQLARRNTGGSDFFGDIANFRLFNRALTSDEVWQLYAYQKEYFGHGDLSMTLKAGRLGIGTSEPRAALDVMGIPHGPNSRPCWRLLGSGVNSDGIWSWSIVQLDNFGGASGSTYYTIPVSGYYFMQVVIIVSASNLRAQLNIRQNGVDVGADFIQDPVTSAIDVNRPWNQLTGMITHYFDEGDQVTVYTTGGTYGGHNCFTGFHLGF